MTASENDYAKLRFELLVAKQERDNGYQDRDKFKEFYKITYNMVQGLVSSYLWC